MFFCISSHLFLKMFGMYRTWMKVRSQPFLFPFPDDCGAIPVWALEFIWVWVNTIDTFLVGWTSIYQLFWGSLGTRVLTHPHMMISLWFCRPQNSRQRWTAISTAPRCRCANLRLVAQIAGRPTNCDSSWYGWLFELPECWNGIENGIEMGMDQNLSPHVTYVTLYLGTLPAILVWRPGDSTGLTAQASWRSCWAWMGTSRRGLRWWGPMRRFCGRWSDGNVGTIIINHPFGNGNHTSY